MDAKTFVTLDVLCRKLGLPAKWIRDEATAGRIPSLRTGRRLMFNPDAVERALLDRVSHGIKKEKRCDRE